jgi:hypothetical protein
VGSGKTISGSADFSVGQIFTREHAPHKNFDQAGVDRQIQVGVSDEERK